MNERWEVKFTHVSHLSVVKYHISTISDGMEKENWTEQQANDSYLFWQLHNRQYTMMLDIWFPQKIFYT